MITNSRQNRKLAYEIGMCRIAMVVDAVHRQMESLPQLSRAMAPCRTAEEQRAQLTYFWWLILGGNALDGVECKLLRVFERSGANRDLFQLWLPMLRPAALPILGERLTDQWKIEIEGLRAAFEPEQEELAIAS